MNDKTSYEVIEIIREMEFMDSEDTFQILQEIVLSFGMVDVVAWLNEIEDGERDGDRIELIENVGIS